MTRRARAAAFTVFFALWGAEAQGQDLAAEADLHFQIGAERYQNRDFRTALEHFLLSNRLVPNRNVVFNIARTYEQLGSFADAYRWYVQALESETEPGARERLSSAVARITPQVAILRVVTDPPGATIYVDRRDLGPRGESPRTLALPPGRHVVFAERAGHRPAPSAPVETALGRETIVELRLEPILGTVRVEGEAGAEVRIDDESSTPRCVVPCELPLAPGRYLVWVSRAGFQASSHVVQVVESQTSVVQARLAAVTGTLVVDSDEPEALIEVDGRSAGFTPSVLTVPVGARDVRVFLEGFRVAERTVQVLANQQTRVRFALQPLQEVSAASRTTEDVEDAPSSVSILQREELRAMAYPTLVEALRGVRGVYVWDDRSYPSVGIRGLGRLGDYGNRVLVLVDGMPINDNILGSSYVGYDFRTDLDDVSRIEVVRGPGSVLYGTNAFSGVVNVVTRTRGEPTGGDVGLSTNEYGVARARGGLRLRLGEDAGIWASIAGAHSQGRDFYFPEFDDPAGLGTDGHARDLDGFDAATFNARAYWKDLSVQWLVHRRSKDLPTAEYETLFGVPGMYQADTRGHMEAAWEPRIGSQLRLLARLFAKYYEFEGKFLYDDTYGGFDVYRERYLGLVGGGELRFQAQLHGAFRLTLGGEIQEQAQADLHGESSVIGTYLDYDPASDRAGAGYLLADVGRGERFRLSAGTRVDAYRAYGVSMNPRLAVIFKPYETGNVKVMGGRAFRAPSTYELYYEDDGNTQDAPDSLDPETITSAEVELTHALSSRWAALVAGYGTYAENLIALGTNENDLSEYTNFDRPVLTIGGEVELRREWRQGWMMSASYGVQRSRYVEPGTFDPARSRQVPNSPVHLAALKGAVPIVPQIVVVASRVTFAGPRFDRFDQAGDPDQRRTDSALVWDLALSGRLERFHLRWSAGVYNAFDWRWSAPVSREFTPRTIPQDGRTFLLSATAEY